MKRCFYLREVLAYFITAILFPITRFIDYNHDSLGCTRISQKPKAIITLFWEYQFHCYLSTIEIKTKIKEIENVSSNY